MKLINKFLKNKTFKNTQSISYPLTTTIQSNIMSTLTKQQTEDNQLLALTLKQVMLNKMFDTILNPTEHLDPTNYNHQQLLNKLQDNNLLHMVSQSLFDELIEWITPDLQNSIRGFEYFYLPVLK